MNPPVHVVGVEPGSRPDNTVLSGTAVEDEAEAETGHEDSRPTELVDVPQDSHIPAFPDARNIPASGRSNTAVPKPKLSLHPSPIAVPFAGPVGAVLHAEVVAPEIEPGSEEGTRHTPALPVTPAAEAEGVG